VFMLFVLCVTLSVLFCINYFFSILLLHEVIIMSERTIQIMSDLSLFIKHNINMYLI